MTNLTPEWGQQLRSRSGFTLGLIQRRDDFRHWAETAAVVLCIAGPMLVTIILFIGVWLSQGSIAFCGTVAFRGPRTQTTSSTSNDRRFNEINTLVEAGDLIRARKMLAEATALRGDTCQTLFLEAKILFREQRYRESMKILERSLPLNQRDAEVFKLVASNAILLSRTDIAEQALKTAAQLAPDDYLVFFHLGAL